MSTIDYHIHTVFSTDADHTPQEIVAMAKKNGVRRFAVADHNRIDNIQKTKELAEKEGITVVPGVEIDCESEGVHFHMTAYRFDLQDPFFDELYHFYYDQNRVNTWKAKEQFCQAMGLQIPDEQLQPYAKDGILVPEEIAAYLLSHSEYDDLSWLDPYRPGGKRSDNPNVNFYWDFFSQGKPGATKGKTLSADEVIRRVHQAHGLCVIAHPGANFREHEDVLERLLDKVDGMEVYSSYHTLEQTQHYHRLACERGLLISCGSDFHGHHKPMIEVGKIPFLQNETEIALF